MDPKTKKWLGEQWDHYWSERRLLRPVVLFSGILFAVEILFWRIHLPTPIDKEYFAVPSAASGTVGYYLVKDSKSKFWLVLSLVVTALSFTVYRYWVETIENSNLSSILLLVLLCSVGCGALFAVIRICMNMGYR